MVITPIQNKNHNLPIIGGVCFIVGLIGFNLYAPHLIKKYNTNELNKARTQINSKQNISSIQTTVEEHKIADIVKQFNEQKNSLIQKWKLNYQRGISVTGVGTFSGNLDIQNAVNFFEFNVAGLGTLKNCISKKLTKFDGNFIAEACHFKGELIIEKSAEFASFNNCLIGKLTIKKAQTIELHDTVVDGDIIFEGIEGTLIIDEKTIICGQIRNCKIIIKRDLKNNYASYVDRN